MLLSQWVGSMWDQEDGSAWMQYVSKAPCGRNEVLTLQQKMEERLTQRQARESGICPVREDLYAQCFDELIRQVTLASPERGMLLMRVRDEARMTIDAYKTLYESSVTFGVRKQLEAEEGVPDMEEEISELQSTKKELQQRVLALRNQLEVMEKRSTERKQLDQAARKEAVDFLRHQNKHLEHFLRSLPGGGGRG